VILVPTNTRNFGKGNRGTRGTVSGGAEKVGKLGGTLEDRREEPVELVRSGPQGVGQGLASEVSWEKSES